MTLKNEQSDFLVIEKYFLPITITFEGKCGNHLKKEKYHASIYEKKTVSVLKKIEKRLIDYNL